MKRFFILLAALVVAASCAQAENVIDHGESPDFVQALLAVAEAELGYVEGGNNYSKYGVWSGDPNAAWCAEFICWCVDHIICVSQIFVGLYAPDFSFFGIGHAAERIVPIVYGK